MYIRNSIKHSVLLNKNCDDNVWILSIKLWNNIKSGVYSALYHSPGMSDSNFLNIFEEWLRDFF